MKFRISNPIRQFSLSLMLFVAFLSMSSLTNICAKSKLTKGNNIPLFTNFEYKGSDDIYKKYPLSSNEFYSPILQGCYPDPSICRKGDDYYLVCSSFAMFPGVPIFHSKDLVNWKQLGHVLDRTSQLQIEDCGISAGIYAPAIRYNPNNDTFYMITTQFSGGFGNIVVKTQDPAKGWSDPIKLNFEGIDPSMFFDEDGRAYVVHNDAPDAGTELYNGHRVIKVWEYDVEKDQIIPGSDQIIVNGGVDLSKRPIWIEAPHIYKKGGKYYLMCAEGGTGGWHSEVIFISDNPKGPFTPAPNNPILSQRYLSKDREHLVDWAGHADLMVGPDGKYYGVFLGVRPNKKGLVCTGRETFILPVEWSGEFPIFENGLIPMEPKIKMPQGIQNMTGNEGYFPNGNFVFTDNFINSLDFRWIGMRVPREEFATIAKNGLSIKPLNSTLKDVAPVSSLFHRQQHNNFTATTTMNYKPKSENDMAGMACYQSEKFHYLFGVTKSSDNYVLVLERVEKGKSEILDFVAIDINNPIQLQVEANGDDFKFNYSENGSAFKTLGGVVSGDILSTNIAGGFTGNLIGLYATTANNVHP